MAIPRRYFPTRSQAELETALRDVEQEMLDGQVLQSWGAGDANAGKWIDPSLAPLKRREMILNDLGILAPATYPPRDLAPIKRTVPRYL